jgi:tRNA A-37 threonylcarbamoyl transferase component Bud32
LESLTGAVLHGKYRVDRLLGEGGMGAVYLAEHVGIGRPVALKVVRPDLLSDATAADRFVREARAVGAIQHRHVVNVTDFGVDRVAEYDVAYLVMEYLHGETLEAVLESRRRLPVAQVVDIVEQVAAALAAAHARGVVHRDLKPANIWLTSDARGGFHVTLLDFGIAKLRDDQFGRGEQAPRVHRPLSAGDVDAAVSTATQVGESIGTPAYMSPEQCVGDAVDLRSDVYSFGVVVYQMLAGELPFRGDTTALLRQHFVADVPPLPTDAGVTSEVEAVLRRALAKEPESRFQSATAFAAALRANASDFGESMRRALVVFAERLPELFRLGVCFALPALVGTVVLVAASPLPRLLQLAVWMLVFQASMFIGAPMAIATVATIFGDLRERPFVRITWQAAARAVTGTTLSGPALYSKWVRVSVGRWFGTSQRAKHNGLKNMILFVDLYRHGGVASPPEQLDTMARVLPRRAFATMAVAQLSALLLLPILGMLVVAGAFTLAGVRLNTGWPVIAGVGGFAFAVANFFQVFIALVDVMLYDLAFDMARDIQTPESAA